MNYNYTIDTKELSEWFPCFGFANKLGFKIVKGFLHFEGFKPEMNEDLSICDSVDFKYYVQYVSNGYSNYENRRKGIWDIISNEFMYEKIDLEK